ncbi:MAG: hypothetical protein VW831_02735 [Gammaproteobacteria bacterium]
MQNFRDADEVTRYMLCADVTATSNLLHGRHGFMKFPFLPAYAAEVLLAVTGLFCLASSFFTAKCIGFIALAASLQPLIKVSTGLVLGVRYSYAYLWYFEPRFKMAYGTYLLLTRHQRMCLHLAGSVGTPLAFACGYIAFSEYSLLALLCLVGTLGTAAMQVAAFVARLNGVTRVGPFSLSHLTTPAMLAEEMLQGRRVTVRSILE